MTKDLILLNPEKGDMTIKQMSSVMRHVEQIENTKSCEVVLNNFRLGSTHIAMIVKVINLEG